MPSNSTTRILIVEDESFVAFALEAMVEDLGYWPIGPYRNLNDGLDHAKADDLDFALLDFNLGDGTDALPIAEVLRSRGIPFAFTTGTAAEEIRASLPAATILSKPLTEAQLEDVLP